MLRVANVSKRFGGVQALQDVSCTMAGGDITGIIGPNGAGKTTLFDVVTGFIAPDQGTVELNGTGLIGHRPSAIARLGLARSFQEVRVFDSLTVAENLYLGRMARNYRGIHVDGLRRRAANATARMVPSVGTDDLLSKLDDEAGSLSFGEQKQLEYARLMSTDARCIMLDEPASGLDMSAMTSLVDMMQTAAEEDRVVILIEHNMEFVRSVCDYVYVLHLGEILTAGAPEDVLADARVRETYLGRG